MVTVGDIIGGGFRLVRERIGSVAVWALLYLALHVAIIQAMRPFMTAMLAMQAARCPIRRRCSAGWGSSSGWRC